MVQKSNGTNYEVNIAARVVNGLHFLNEPGRREDMTKDKVFIKALLISVCKLTAIRELKSNDQLPRELLAFIKGKIQHK